MQKTYYAKITPKTYPKGLVLYLDYKDESGKRVTKKTHSGYCACKRKRCPHTEAAEKVKADFLARQKRKQESGIGDIFYTELVKEYMANGKGGDKAKLTVRRDEQTLRFFGHFLEDNGILKVSEITLPLLIRYRDGLKNGTATGSGRKANNGGVNFVMRHVAAFLSYGVKTKAIEENPIVGNRKLLFFTPQDKINYLTYEEIDAFKANTTGWVRDMFLILLNSGMRINELLQLRHCDVQGDVIHLRVRDEWRPKSKRGRSIPANTVVQEVLKRRKEEAAGEYVFSTATGTAYLYRNVLRGFQVAYTKIGAKGHFPGVGCCIHTIRHTAASIMVNDKGIAVSTASKLLGHSTISVTMKYVHATEDHLREAVDKLNL